MPDDLAERLDALGVDFAEKVAGCVAFIKNQEAYAAALTAQAQAFDRRALKADCAAVRVKEYVKINMAMLGMKSMEAGLFPVRIQANGGKQPLFITPEIAELPKGYHKLPVTADSEKIRAALEAGQEVAGCKLLPKGTHLRIG